MLPSHVNGMSSCLYVIPIVPKNRKEKREKRQNIREQNRIDYDMRECDRIRNGLELNETLKIQYNIMQYNATQLSAINCNRIQFLSIQCSTVLHKTAQYNAVQYSIVSIVQCNNQTQTNLFVRVLMRIYLLSGACEDSSLSLYNISKIKQNKIK